MYVLFQLAPIDITAINSCTKLTLHLLSIFLCLAPIERDL